MGKKNRPKLEKKRKALKKQRKTRLTRHAAAPAVLAYSGRKYRTADLVPLHLATETAIFEADCILERMLSDAEVMEAIEQIVLRVRSGHMSDLAAAAREPLRVSSHSNVVTQRILAHWHGLAEDGQLPGEDTLVGVLRTILGSIETWKMAGRESRGYLVYLEGFLKKAGINVQVVAEEDSDDETADAADDDQGEPAADAARDAAELLDLGSQWRQSNDADTGIAFRNFGLELIERGQGRMVGDACRRLIDGDFDPVRIAELSALALTADKAIGSG